MSPQIKATTVVSGGVAVIHSAGSRPGDIAGTLLASADHPGQVRTVTTPEGIGWQVPEHVAQAAGLVAAPAKRRRKRVTSNS